MEAAMQQRIWLGPGTHGPGLSADKMEKLRAKSTNFPSTRPGAMISSNNKQIPRSEWVSRNDEKAKEFVKFIQEYRKEGTQYDYLDLEIFKDMTKNVYELKHCACFKCARHDFDVLQPRDKYFDCCADNRCGNSEIDKSTYVGHLFRCSACARTVTHLHFVHPDMVCAKPNAKFARWKLFQEPPKRFATAEAAAKALLIGHRMFSSKEIDCEIQRAEKRRRMETEELQM